VPVALAQATPTQREAIMSALKHILVVANQTVAGERLIAAVRSRAAADPVRVTVICPQNDPSDSWVVDEAAVAAATRSRLEATLAALRSPGIEAVGHVVDRDPYSAVLDVLASDPPDAMIVSPL